jgi:osmoprotectant transport system permease protein
VALVAFAAVARLGRWRGHALVLSAVALVTSTAFALGSATTDLLAGEPAASRVSVSGAVWVILVGAFAVILAGRESWTGPSWLRSILIALALAGVVAALAWGGLDQTSLAREFGVRAERFWTQALEHLVLTGAGLGIGLAVGLPLGVWATRNRAVRRVALYVVSIIQTIPSLAVLGLLIAPLAALAAAFPVLAALGVRGIGVTPAVIALTLYALLPIVRNTYTGLSEVSEGVKEAGRGMGMSRGQLLARVELPLALPLIFEGVRLAAVLLVGITALTALNGAGGLGFFIFEGLNQAAPDLILLGSLPTIALAVLLDQLLRVVARVAVPEGVRAS